MKNELVKLVEEVNHPQQLDEGVSEVLQSILGLVKTPKTPPADNVESLKKENEELKRRLAAIESRIMSTFHQSPHQKRSIYYPGEEPEDLLDTRGL